MRIAFLCKRKYTGKDVIKDRFGRLHAIPWHLAQLGHEVKGFCLDYHQQDEAKVFYDVAPGCFEWEAHGLGMLRLPQLIAYPWMLLSKLRSFRPDILLGASDIPHAALTAWLSKQLKIPYALDLYDNFESFGQAHIPGAVTALKWSVRGAGLVIVVSDPLRSFIKSKYGLNGPIIVMPNAIDRSLFNPGNRLATRKRLQLPLQAELVGTAGALSRSKGVKDLYEAWPYIAAARPCAHLVLAGPLEVSLPLPEHERLHYLGNIEHSGVADLFNALDVGVVTVADSQFGRYCFPQKAYEMIACDLPIVATSIGVMPTILRETPNLLYNPGDHKSLAKIVTSQLESKIKAKIYTRDWSETVSEIEPRLRSLVISTHKSRST